MVGAIGYEATAHADDEAAVREALVKTALSFEKNDLAMASQVWANDESGRSSRAGTRTMAGPITATIISSPRWER